MVSSHSDHRRRITRRKNPAAEGIRSPAAHSPEEEKQMRKRTINMAIPRKLLDDKGNPKLNITPCCGARYLVTPIAGGSAVRTCSRCGKEYPKKGETS